MAFLVDEAYLPAILTMGPMTDEAFAQLCAEHPDLNLEMSAHGELIVMPLTYTWTEHGTMRSALSSTTGPARTNEALPSIRLRDGCCPTPPGARQTRRGSSSSESGTCIRLPLAGIGRCARTS